MEVNAEDISEGILRNMYGGEKSLGWGRGVGRVEKEDEDG